jgi:hypothetical protein
MARVAVLRCCTKTGKVRSRVRNRPLNWVELRGFEPLTPSMRTRCATGLRYSPKNASQRSKQSLLLAPYDSRGGRGGPVRPAAHPRRQGPP